jgi:hypothetical protein
VDELQALDLAAPFGLAFVVGADAVGAAEGYAPPFRMAITRRLRSSPAFAFAASWRKRPSTGRSMRPRSRKALFGRRPPECEAPLVNAGVQKPAQKATQARPFIDLVGRGRTLK